MELRSLHSALPTWWESPIVDSSLRFVLAGEKPIIEHYLRSVGYTNIPDDNFAIRSGERVFGKNTQIEAKFARIDTPTNYEQQDSVAYIFIDCEPKVSCSANSRRLQTIPGFSMLQQVVELLSSDERANEGRRLIECLRENYRSPHSYSELNNSPNSEDGIRKRLHQELSDIRR